MLNVVAVYDSAAAAYGNPMFVVAVGVALRAFEDVCLKANSPVAAHPEHYTLHELGVYDPNSGKFENLPQPKWLASASQIVARAAAARLKHEPELPGVYPNVVADPSGIFNGTEQEVK